MNESISRRSFVVSGALALGGSLALAGCLGDDDDDDDVPDASFDIVDQEFIEIGPEGDKTQQSQLTVAHNGDALTIENTHSVEVRFQDTRVDALTTAEEPIDGNELQVVGDTESFAPGNTIEFVWISPDGEVEAVLNEATIPTE